jgi:hypothetical protein
MKSMLLICEGKHDVAFLKVILEKKLNFRNYTVNVQDIQEPIGGYLLSQIQGYEYDENRLRDGPKLPIILENKRGQNTFFAILYAIDGLNSSGVKSAKKVIKDYYHIINFGRKHPEHYKPAEMSLGFVFDADKDGIENRVQWVKEQFSEAYIDLSELNNDDVIKHTVFSGIGLYILANDEGIGNLESILLPIYSKGLKDQAEHIEKFLNDNQFERKHNGIKHDDKTESDKKKSIFAILGQFEYSGFANAELIFRSSRIGGLLNGEPQIDKIESFMKKLKSIIN